MVSDKVMVVDNSELVAECLNINGWDRYDRKRLQAKGLLTVVVFFPAKKNTLGVISQMLSKAR